MEFLTIRKILLSAGQVPLEFRQSIDDKMPGKIINIIQFAQYLEFDNRNEFLN